MTGELEVIGAASVGALAQDTTGDGYLDKGPCPNCGTEINGEFCRTCGQSSRDLRKPFISLVSEMFIDVFSLDGRLWRTLPALIFRPGHVTKSYIEGKRARYVPPFRLFLIASVVFFIMLFGFFERQDWLDGDDVGGSRDIQAAIGEIPVADIPLAEYENFDTIFDEDGELDEEALEGFINGLIETDVVVDVENPEDLAQIIANTSKVSASRRELFTAIQKWAPRLSFLLLPLFVIALTSLHFWIRRIYVFHHVIVAMHLQTFLYLASTIVIPAALISPMWAWLIFGLGVPIYTYRLMRKTYETSRILTGFRLFLLFIFSTVILSLLIAAVAIISAEETGLLQWSDLQFGEPQVISVDRGGQN